MTSIQTLFVVFGTLWLISIFFGSILPMMWKNHKWLRENIPFLRNNYIGNWTGDNSARFTIGNTNFGYNADSNHVYVIHNGGINRPSIQVSIDPKLDKSRGYLVPFSIWGVVWPWDYLRTVKQLSMSFSEADMYRLNEAQLGVLPAMHPLRKELEDDLRNSVARTIQDVRAGNNVNLQLIRDSLKVRSYLASHSFASWHSRRGILIGRKRSMQIGKEVCANHKFSLEEAETLFASKKKS